MTTETKPKSWYQEPITFYTKCINKTLGVEAIQGLEGLRYRTYTILDLIKHLSWLDTFCNSVFRRTSDTTFEIEEWKSVHSSHQYQFMTREVPGYVRAETHITYYTTTKFIADLAELYCDKVYNHKLVNPFMICLCLYMNIPNYTSTSYENGLLKENGWPEAKVKMVTDKYRGVPGCGLTLCEAAAIVSENPGTTLEEILL